MRDKLRFNVIKVSFALISFNFFPFIAICFAYSKSLFQTTIIITVEQTWYCIHSQNYSFHSQNAYFNMQVSYKKTIAN